MLRWPPVERPTRFLLKEAHDVQVEQAQGRTVDRQRDASGTVLGRLPRRLDQLEDDPAVRGDRQHLRLSAIQAQKLAFPGRVFSKSKMRPECWLERPGLVQATILRGEK